MDMNTRLTKKGKFIRALMFVLSILFFCAILVVYVGAILWLGSMEKELGTEFVQDTYAPPTGIFSIIGMIVLGVLGWKCMSISCEI
jgi:mannose/fructose/N-acetylgalactosamine-specific phosphotransferase system component IID